MTSGVVWRAAGRAIQVAALVATGIFVVSVGTPAVADPTPNDARGVPVYGTPAGYYPQGIPNFLEARSATTPASGAFAGGGAAPRGVGPAAASEATLEGTAREIPAVTNDERARKAPRGENDVPRGENDVPHGENDVPRGDERGDHRAAPPDRE
jgi:hypothetical protein